MSTIEKAASRIAARRKAGASPETEARSAGPEGRAGGDSPVRPVAALPQRERLCDIDLAALEERGFLVPGAGRTQLAHEMRRIKRPLLLNLQKALAREGAEAPDGEPANPANLIMITSAVPGEGKTFVAINLAMSMAAEVDRRVLLVDADVARGDVSRQLEIEPRRGLSDLLQETAYLAEDGVLSTNVERLSILPAGAVTDQVDELFASELMGVITRDLAAADPNRIVVFDASPLLATTEAAVLARHMGQTVMVVEANKTPQEAVSQALAQLEGCSNVSLVLNKSTSKEHAGYGYGYGYGYGSEARDRTGTVNARAN